MKIRNKITIAYAVVAVAFAITIYFLLPYILPIFGIKSYMVISRSMDHIESSQAFFESFYEERGVNPEDLHIRYGLERADLIIITPQESYKIGDVIVLEKPGSRLISVHRIYEHNSTHFRDVGDRCIREENLRMINLALHDFDLVAYEKNETLPTQADKIYEGPRYEQCSHYWMPVSAIQGKVSLVFPQAAFFLHISKGIEVDDPEEIGV